MATTCELVNQILDIELERPVKINPHMTGPREISIGDPAAIPLVHGLRATVKKGPFYAALTDSLHTTDDAVFHKERRKIWDFAMKECMYR